MTLTEMFTICDSCVYAPCICGNDPENCVAYVRMLKTKYCVRIKDPVNTMEGRSNAIEDVTEA